MMLRISRLCPPLSILFSRNFGPLQSTFIVLQDFLPSVNPLNCNLLSPSLSVYVPDQENCAFIFCCFLKMSRQQVDAVMPPHTRVLESSLPAIHLLTDVSLPMTSTQSTHSLLYSMNL